MVRDQAFATLALSGELGRGQLAGPDRALATEIVYGVLRNRTRLDRALASAVPKKLKVAPKIRIALWVGAYQILFLDRVPDHAAVDDAVMAVKKIAGNRMAGFANALLRQLASSGEPPFTESAGVPRMAAEFSMPEWIINRIAAELSPEELEVAVAAFARPAPITARANRLKISRDELLSLLKKEWPAATLEPSPLAPEAISVTGMGAPEASPSFQNGLFSIQDVGAQRVSHLIALTPGMRILDACSGVGGKASHLAELSDNRARICAADSSQRKLDLLADTARRLGITCIERVQADLSKAEELPEGLFDAVLLDAPCTGLGVLRRHPEAKWRLSESAIEEMVKIQRQLLANLAGKVRPGGILVYSVCSFVSAEGPEQVAEFLNSHSDFVQTSWFRTWPHRDNADAFFAAALQRTG